MLLITTNCLVAFLICINKSLFSYVITIVDNSMRIMKANSIELLRVKEKMRKYRELAITDKKYMCELMKKQTNKIKELIQGKIF